jgi:magnesium chelatase family protein
MVLRSQCAVVGPPGSGKTMLARALPSILPPMTVAESLEVTKIYSVWGLLPAEMPLLLCARWVFRPALTTGC